MPRKSRARKDRWQQVFPDFEIEQARVVATFGADRGAIVENLEKLHCNEGRMYTFQTSHGKGVHAFEYQFTFREADSNPTSAGISTIARIVITGLHKSGHRVEIRGDGWIGYNDLNKIEGRFDVAPVVLTDDWEPEPEEMPEEDVSPSRLARILLPSQFIQASIRFPPEEEEYEPDPPPPAPPPPSPKPFARKGWGRSS